MVWVRRRVSYAKLGVRVRWAVGTLEGSGRSLLTALERRVAVCQAENLVTYAKEIAARPQRSWFQTGKERKQESEAAAAAARGEGGAGSSRSKRRRDDSDDEEDYGTRTYGGGDSDGEEEPRWKKWEKMSGGRGQQSDQRQATAKERKKATARRDMGDDDDTRMGKLPGKVRLSVICRRSPPPWGPGFVQEETRPTRDEPLRIALVGCLWFFRWVGGRLEWMKATPLTCGGAIYRCAPRRAWSGS